MIEIKQAKPNLVYYLIPPFFQQPAIFSLLPIGLPEKLNNNLERYGIFERLQ